MFIDLLILFYSFFIILLGLGILRNWFISKERLNTFSILIACRNEEKLLPFLLKSLLSIDYPEELYEVIIVDDASNDSSVEIIKKHIIDRKNYQLIEVKEKSKNFLGKKYALSLAAEKATKDFLVFTDGDCIVPENWLKSYNKFFGSKTAMVLGYSPEIDAKGFKKFLSLISAGIYASTTGLGHPFSCTGRNMAVRKKVFREVGGYSKIKKYVSGDDKLLLSLIKRTKYYIKYNYLCKVYTFSENNNFSEQQKRRYGKFFMNPLKWKILCILIFLFYIYLPVKVVLDKDLLSLIFYILAYSFSWSANCFKHEEKIRVIDFIYILIYPYFVIYYSLKSILFRWKWKN